MDINYLAQVPTSPVFVPDGVPNYPIFDVSLENPLPPKDIFIQKTADFILPPVTIFISALIGVSIFQAIIKSFRK